MGWVQVLRAGLHKKGIDLTPGQEESFRLFTKELLAANEKMNLTAIKDEEEIAQKHYLDSLAVMDFSLIPQGARVIDIGSGAGFPGIPLAVMRPDITLLMIDSTAKKIGFISGAIEVLGLSNARALSVRAEELAREGAHRERYDAAVSRAVANLRALAELSLAFVKPGGVFLALKGQKAETEIADAKAAIQKMGGRLEEIILNGMIIDEYTHSTIKIAKIAKTPPEYPRSFAKILKSPL